MDPEPVPSPVVMPVRPATPGDAAAISAIYNHAVLHSTATFQEQPETVADRRAWLQAHGPAHPVLVAETAAGEVVGWASLSPFHPRSAFRHTVETSVYIDEHYQRRGLGRRLTEALLERARDLGHHRVLATISGDQPASIALHESLGFVPAGRLHEVGRKFGKWLDLVILEKRLP